MSKPMYFHRGALQREITEVTNWFGSYEEAHRATLENGMHGAVIQTIRVPVTKANFLALLNGDKLQGVENSPWDKDNPARGGW